MYYVWLYVCICAFFAYSWLQNEVQDFPTKSVYLLSEVMTSMYLSSVFMQNLFLFVSGAIIGFKLLMLAKSTSTAYFKFWSIDEKSNQFQSSQPPGYREWLPETAKSHILSHQPTKGKLSIINGDSDSWTAYFWKWHQKILLPMIIRMKWFWNAWFFWDSITYIKFCLVHVYYQGWDTCATWFKQIKYPCIWI